MVIFTLFLMIILVLVLVKRMCVGEETNEEDHFSRPFNQLPRPIWPSLPVMGHSYLMAWSPLITLLGYSQKLGPIFRFDLGFLPTVVITTHKLMSEAFKSDDINGRPYNLMPSFELMMRGRGVDGALPGFAGSQGKTRIPNKKRKNWREQRHFFLNRLKSSAKTTESVVQDEAVALVAKMCLLLSQGKGEVAMHQFFMSATVNTIWRLSTDLPLGRDDKRVHEVVNCIYDFFKFLKPGPASFLQLRFPWVMRLCERLGLHTGTSTYTRMLDLIEGSLKPIKDQDSINGEVIANRLARRFFEHRQNSPLNSSFQGEVGWTNLVATLGDIFMGGSDTTNNQMEWVMLFLAYYPEWQERLRVQILDIFGFKTRPSLHMQTQLPLVEAFLLEVQRVRPIAPLALPRLTTKETRLGGYTIPKNTQVMVNLTAISMDPGLYAEPELFKPERFLDERGRVVGRELIARNFGAGRRRCPGERLTKCELFVFLCSLLQAFKFGLASTKDLSEKETFDGIFGLNYVPKPYTLFVEELDENDIY